MWLQRLLEAIKAFSVAELLVDGEPEPGEVLVAHLSPELRQFWSLFHRDKLKIRTILEEHDKTCKGNGDEECQKTLAEVSRRLREADIMKDIFWRCVDHALPDYAKFNMAVRRNGDVMAHADEDDDPLKAPETPIEIQGIAWLEELALAIAAVPETELVKDEAVKEGEEVIFQQISLPTRQLHALAIKRGNALKDSVLPTINQLTIGEFLKKRAELGKVLSETKFLADIFWYCVQDEMADFTSGISIRGDGQIVKIPKQQSRTPEIHVVMVGSSPLGLSPFSLAGLPFEAILSEIIR